MNFVRRLVQEEEGASLVEYGLLVALIAVVAMGAIATVGSAVAQNFTDIAAAL